MKHITRLQADNFKKLSVIDIQPGTSAGIVPIRGRNAQGKSSTLDAIMAALGGKERMPSVAVRKGEDEGAIRLELDSGEVVLRRFTADGKDSIEVTNAEGFKSSSPQRLLDTLYASVAFDPLEFTRLKPAVQLETLRGLVKLDVNLDALKADNKADYDKRRDVNRELERERTLFNNMPHYADAPAEPIDTDALISEMAAASQTNTDIERQRLNHESRVRTLAENNEKLAAHRTRLEELKSEVETLEALIFQFEEAIEAQRKAVDEAPALPAPVDVADVQQKLTQAQVQNERLAANRKREAARLLVEQLEQQSKALTEAMEARDREAAEALERAEMPVAGISFGDGEVLFNGVPLEQASSAEQLRVSTAIGMATSPKLRVMLVRDGSLLDDEGQQILAEMAEQHDFQLWVEAVDTSGKVGIVLEDGAVVAIDGEPAPKPEEIAKPKRRAKKEAVAADDVFEPGKEPELDVKIVGDKLVIDDEIVPEVQSIRYEPDAETPAGAPSEGAIEAKEPKTAPLPAGTKPAAPSLFD